MPVAPEIEPLLREFARQPPMHQMPIERLRQVRPRIGATDVQPVAEVEDLTVPGPAGTVRVRRYAPEPRGGLLPLIVFFHGGGFVFGSLDGYYDHVCRVLCAQAHCRVISVDYRLAPEHPFPAASDDCVAVVRWAIAHADMLGVDPARVFVAGGSAGANLAAVTALRLRDEGGLALRGQLLYYPVTDYPEPPTGSMIEFAEGYYLTRDDLAWFWKQYLANQRDAGNPYAAPLKAPSLWGLPAAMVVTAEYDPLRDEGEHYARRLVDAGVPVSMHRFEGMVHGFLAFPTPKSSLALLAGADWIREQSRARSPTGNT